MDVRYRILAPSCLSFSLSPSPAPFWCFWRIRHAVGSSRQCFSSPIMLCFETLTRTTWRTSSCLWRFIRLQTTPSSPWSQPRSITKWCVISDFFHKAHQHVKTTLSLQYQVSFNALQCFLNLCLFLAQFLKVYDELAPGFEAILASGHMGVIVQVVESCVHREERQADMLQHLLEVKLSYYRSLCRSPHSIHAFKAIQMFTFY